MTNPTSDILKVCEKLQNAAIHATELHSLKKEDSRQELQDTLNSINALLLDLRRTSRLYVISQREAKDQAGLAKNKVDQLHMDVQNLRYEDLHLERELAQHEEFETIFQDVPLVDEQQFWDDVSPEVADDSRNNPHQYMLNRLAHEMQLREKLQEEREALVKRCKELADSNQAKRLELEKMETSLDNVLQAMEPLEKQVPNFERTSITSEVMTQLYNLPEPLFVLYRHATAYRDVFDGIKVRVLSQGEHEGQNLEKLRAALTSQSKSMDVEMEDGKKTEHSVEDLYKMTPSRVEVDVLDEQGSDLLTLRFSHLSTLGIVIVSPESHSPSLSGLSLRDMLGSLLPGDDGLRSPNPANSLLTFGGNSFMFHASDAGGHCYQWAQSLCGLDFPPTDEQRKAYDGKLIVKPTFPKMIPMILERCHAWQDLKKSLDILSQHKLPSGLDVIEGVKISKWSNVSQSKHTTFEAKFEHNKKTVIAHISLGPGYPVGESPRFMLDFANKEQAEELEKKLHAFPIPLQPGLKLAHQIHFLMQQLNTE